MHKHRESYVYLKEENDDDDEEEETRRLSNWHIILLSRQIDHL